MSDPRPHESDLDRGDADLVRQIAESYRPDALSPGARVAFRNRLDARIRRRARVRLWIAGAATATVAAAVVLLRGSLPEGPPQSPGSPMAAVSSEEEALLALALAASEAESLPSDYQAIEALFLEGEGV